MSTTRPEVEGLEDAVPERIAERMQFVRGGRSYAHLASALGLHTETVRRQFITGRPGPELLSRMALHYGVNADWMLTGRGSSKWAPTLRPRDLSVRELLLALAEKFEAQGADTDGATARAESHRAVRAQPPGDGRVTEPKPSPAQANQSKP